MTLLVLNRHWQPGHGARPVPENGPRKPAFHQACNRCGLCCVAEPCAIAQIMMPGIGAEGPCPALEWKDGISACGMVTRPAYYSPYVRAAIERRETTEEEIRDMVISDLGGVGPAGRGCDSDPVGNPGALDGLTAAEYLRRAQ